MSATPGAPMMEVHLEELGQHSWIKALANTLTGSFGSAQLRFVACPPGDRHRAADHVVTGATFPVLRAQDLDDVHLPNAWLDTARHRLDELDGELRGLGWRPGTATGRHWWYRTDVAG